MCVGKKELRVIEDCLQKLASLMVTFRTYGGKNIDINRGEFDIDFFKGLNDVCSDIHDRLSGLLHDSSQDNEKTAKVCPQKAPVAIKPLEVATSQQQ